MVLTTCSVVHRMTMEDVAWHDRADDCLIVIHGLIYDVTKFLEDHPGGAEVMLSMAGEDATRGFEDVGHSAEARSFMSRFLIGCVDDCNERDVDELSVFQKWRDGLMAVLSFVGYQRWRGQR